MRRWWQTRTAVVLTLGLPVAAQQAPLNANRGTPGPLGGRAAISVFETIERRDAGDVRVAMMPYPERRAIDEVLADLDTPEALRVSDLSEATS